MSSFGLIIDNFVMNSEYLKFNSIFSEFQMFQYLWKKEVKNSKYQMIHMTVEDWMSILSQ